jgi:hypothetical protein
MKLATRVSGALISFCALSASQPAGAVDTTWTAAVNNDFYNAGNWNTNAFPTGADNVLILNPAVTASINFAGTREIGSFHLGASDRFAATGGNVDFSGGQLVVHADFDSSHVGDQGSLDSKFVMRGNAVMLYDEPLSGGGLGTNGNNQDLEIGAQTGFSGHLGLLELHDNAILRISDDLKVGAEDIGNGEVLIDGNAQISAGSGISISEAITSKGKMTVAGTALVVSGNSAGAGNSVQGATDEGYFTLSTSNDGTADVLIKNSGKVYARTLQQRGGVSNFTIQDNGEFHVFDTFNFATPNLGVATVVGDPTGTNPQRANNVAENNGSQFNLFVTGNGKVSIDSAVDDGSGFTLKGLALSGGNNRGQVIGSGGASKIDLSSNASFVIQQNLYMTVSNGAADASSNLRVVGPNVDAEIKGDLLMSYDPVNQFQNPGQSTLTAVITGATHSTIVVGGEAKIEFGNLAVELSGYAPQGGETYTLLTANSIGGTSFLNTPDFTLAPLASGLSWDVNVGATSVVLKVLGSIALPGDFDSDQDVDGADFLKWQRNFGTPGYDAASLATWKANFGATAAVSAAAAVPEPHAILLAAMAIGVGAACRRRDA